MKLNEKDAKLFFELWIPLLNYTNQKYKINPALKKFCKADEIEIEEAKLIAGYLWNHTEIIDEYLKETSLSEENHNIIAKWKNCISGKFIIERHLKKGSVFISYDTEEVYIVNGITTSWEEMFFFMLMPVCINATLIPFKDKIITDGLITFYNVSFGKGYSSEFKEIYMEAKKNKTIHTNL